MIREHLDGKIGYESDAVLKHVCGAELRWKAIEECVTALKAHGPAFEATFYNFGDSPYFWTDNGEYTTPIRFCPFCGMDLFTLHEEWKASQPKENKFEWDVNDMNIEGTK
jgi:hypothetical protein